MKSDVLDTFKTVKACVAYGLPDGTETDEFPFDCEAVKPLYEEFPGWLTDLTKVTGEDEFPEEFNSYISFLEEYLETPVSIVSVGPDRKQTVFRKL
jgi:adenylosuccinate synthase